MADYALLPATSIRRRWRAGFVAVAVLASTLAFAGTAAAQPPDQAALIGPADGSTLTGPSAQLQVRASDPDGGTVSVAFEGRPKGATTPGGGDPFTFVVVPDTQNYTYSGRQGTILQQAQWIVGNRATMNTAFVAQVGDLVSEYDNMTQWTYVSNGLRPLNDAGVPNSVVPGNHDFNNATGDIGPYDTYFPPSRFANAAWAPATSRYGGYLGQSQFGPDPIDRRNMDNYALFSAGGTDFLVLNLEWEAPQYALDWADRVLKAYPDRTAIMTTHSFVSISGALRTTAQRPGGTPPAAMWSSFVSTHCQIRLVLSGHEHSGDLGEARRTDTNTCGQPVQLILSDYQDRANGGDGWLRYYTFDPAAGTIAASTYSPKLNQFETDADSSFTLPFPFANQTPAPFAAIGSATVASGATATATWSGLAEDTQYEWRAVVGDGTSAVTSATWTLRTAAKARTLSDPFRRSVTGGWGSADTGQAWGASNPGSFSVDGEWAAITVPKGAGRSVRPAGVMLTDSLVETDLRSVATPSGSGTYVSLLARENGTSSYRAKLTLRSNGSTTLSINRVVNGAETALRSTTLPAMVAAGATARVRFEVTGTSPTALRATAWRADLAEPGGWMLTATDSTTALQSAGGVAVDVYVSSTATTTQTVQFDRYSASGPGSPPPPSNASPTAVIAAPVINGRTVQFSGNGSTDSDGTVTGWRWAFGDGQFADGVTATRTYESDGTFQVTLTATDDDGATGTANVTVTVSAPPVIEAARDQFERTTANGWGIANTGGAWTTTGAATRYSVTGGAGRHTLTSPGATAESSLAAVSTTGSDTRVSISWNRSAATGKIYTTVVPRMINSTSDYRVSVVIATTGRPTVTLIRRVAGTELNIGSVSPPVVVAADTPCVLAVRLAPIGGSTTLSAKFWSSGESEPAAWQVSATDGTVALQGSGSFKLISYLSSSATQPIVASFDDLTVTRR